MPPARAAMILCAGLGTRLRPLTDTLAKPMVPVGDEPALAHVVRGVRLAASRLVVNVHHRPNDVRAWAEPEGIAVSHEPDLLGTAGGVAGARDLLGEGDVLVWNGDILTELDPRVLFDAHSHEATLAVKRRAAGEGNVGIAADGSVVRLRKEAIGDPARETIGGDFLGIHVVGRALREQLPTKGCLVGDVYLPALRRGARLDARFVDAPFVDVGTLAQYFAANAAWLTARGLPSWAHPSAIVGAEISSSVVGAGARVDAPAERCVVWPGAHVREPTADAIVTSTGCFHHVA